jgi:hypothetical protein
MSVFKPGKLKKALLFGPNWRGCTADWLRELRGMRECEADWLRELRGMRECDGLPLYCAWLRELRGMRK